MPQMMMDLLQYVPYALLVLFVTMLFAGGVLYTLRFFRKADARIASQTVSFNKN